jgi:hypothetical protein
MRILLDAKDLINVVEHSKPLTISDLDAWLRQRNSSLVYSLENVRALAAPIGIDPAHLSRIRGYVEQLDELPHCYVTSGLDLLELRSALVCFEASKEYESIDPYVPRFDYVFPPFANPDRLIYPFGDIVHDLWKACPRIFEPQTKMHKIQAMAMSMDREKSQSGRSRPAQAPFEPILEFLVLKMPVTQERAREVASWVARNPSRCPGLWMIRAVGSAMSQNRGYSARKDDVFDMSQIMVVPYVDAATVDRTMFDYCLRAEKSLDLADSVSRKSTKVFRNLQDLIQAMG